ncbi:MAG: helix-turn-helix transcriptional regulator, partial [Burkholderiales bacterium]|nr:helix-turn-helix transcriptional regulator [Burkholderiales bacterium]
MSQQRRRTRTVAMGLVRLMARSSERRGLEAAVFRRQAGLGEAEFRTQEARLDGLRYRSVLQTFQECCIAMPLRAPEAPGLGALLDELPDLGALLCNCASLGQALGAYVRYRAAIGELDSMAGRSDGEGAEFHYLPSTTGVGASISALGNFKLLTGIVRHYEAQAGVGQAAPIECVLGHRLPRAALPDWPGVAWRCEAGAALRLRLSTPLLAAPAPGFNATLHAHSRRRLERQLGTLDGAPALADEVREQLQALWAEPGGPPAEGLLQATAQRLGMSRWTLRRHLEAEATSFQGLLDEHRALRALELLRNPALSMLQISQQLGFASQSSFTRFFRACFGVARGPSAWRAPAAAQEPGRR